MPLVSVIIPNYNHALFLKERLESILNQNYQNLEIIILDDCSTDTSKQVIDQYRNHPKVSHTILNIKNSGSTFSQWKKGIDNSKGELIWIAESDDKAAPDFLEKIVPLFDENNIGLAYSQSFRYNKNEVQGMWDFHTKNLNEKLWQNDFSMKGIDFVQNYMFYKNPIPNASAVVFRKAIYDKTGGIDTGFTINGDWYLYTKLLAVSDIAFVSTPLNYFREHDNKGSSKNVLNGNNAFEYYKLVKGWMNQFHPDSNVTYSLRECAFNIWYFTFNKSIYKMLRTNFARIFKIASSVDETILLRLLRCWKASMFSSKMSRQH